MKKKKRKKKIGFEFAKTEDLPLTKGQFDRHRAILDERFHGIDRKFDAIYRRFEAIDKRFEEVDKRFQEIDHRFDVLEKKMDKKFEEVDRRFQSIEERLEQMHRVLLNIAADISDQRRYSSYVLDKYNLVGDKLENHEERIQQLESPELLPDC